MNIENQQPDFPEGYDPHAEVEQIMRDDSSDMRDKALYEANTNYFKAESRMGESRWKFVKGLGLAAMGVLMAPFLQLASQPEALQEHMARAYEQQGTSGEALLVALLVYGLGVGVGSTGVGVKSLIDSIRGMRKAKHEMKQASQDLDMFSQNTEAL